MPGRPRSPGARSDTSDADLDGIAEVELARLRRVYRNMEGDRQAYTQESQDLIRRQKSEIHQLEDEKRELLKELRLAESRSNQVMDDRNIDTLSSLGEAKETQDQEISDEKQTISELDTRIKEWERKIREQHKHMGGVHMSAQHTVQTQKNIHTLENRLDKALKKFSSCLTENKKLREEIESLRVERKRFDHLYKKVDKQLNHLRRDTGETIDSSIQAYDSRDEAQMKMLLLKDKADKDKQQHNAEIKELIRIIDHDRKLKEFMGLKGQERSEDPQLVAWRQKRETLEVQRKKASQEDSVESYEVAFERIKEMTGEDDLDLLVTRFIEVEDRNFALFNYVNEQNNEMEMLIDQIDDIHSEIEAFKKQGIEMESQRKTILKNLEERQVLASSDGDEYEQKYKEISKILDQLQAGINSLFGKINCDRSAIDDMLGAATGVTDTNMLQYLGIIEQRSNELLAVHGYINSKDLDKFDHQKPVSLLGGGPQAPSQLIPVLPPSVGDEYESDGSEVSEEDSRPFTRNELQTRVIKTVKKREMAARNEGYKYDLSNAREKTQKKEKKEGKKA